MIDRSPAPWPLAPVALFPVPAPSAPVEDRIVSIVRDGGQDHAAAAAAPLAGPRDLEFSGVVSPVSLATLPRPRSPLSPSVIVTRKISAMSETWNWGGRDVSARTPLHGGEHAGLANDRGEQQTRHILLGVSHVSDDPARHRHFEIRATYDQAANGWVAPVAEQNRNEQPEAWAAEVLADGAWSHVFPTAATCLGDAVTSIVTLVDREA